MAIDKTKRPLKIPPQFQMYAEEHGIFDLYHRMLQQLIIDRPEDPLDYMINWFKRESDPVPKVAIIGAPASGKHSIAEKLAEKLGAVLVKASPHANSDQEIVAELTDRLRAPGSEPVRRGYILEDLPKNKRQALLLQQNGISMDHVLVLEAPEDILLGRRVGKFIDPTNGNDKVYHKLFDWPEDESKASQLIKAENANKESFEKDLRYWKREKIGIIDAYKNADIIRHVNSDQPIIDVAEHILTVASQPNRSEATIIPRLVILGAKGSGKKTIAKSLSEKYKMVEVDAEKWIRIVSSDRGSSTGDAIRTFMRESNIEANPNPENPDQAEKYMNLCNYIPDELFVRCINDRLSRMDCQTKGWCLYNFPRNFQQVEALNMLGHRPNKVFSFEIPLESSLERLTNRMIDPETGHHYHMIWNPPTCEDSKNRLVKAPHDSNEAVEKHYMEYMNTIGAIKKTYLDQQKQYEKIIGGIFVTINADQDLNTVLEYCESMLINPIPIES